MGTRVGSHDHFFPRHLPQSQSQTLRFCHFSNKTSSGRFVKLPTGQGGTKLTSGSPLRLWLISTSGPVPTTPSRHWWFSWLRRSEVMRLIPKLFPGHVLGDTTVWSTSFVSQSPGTIADQWEGEDLDRTTKTSDIGRKEFWYQPRSFHHQPWSHHTAPHDPDLFLRGRTTRF